MNKKLFFIITLLFGLSFFQLQAQRQVEKLNRGVVVTRNGDQSAYVGWRLLALEDWKIGFNVYKSVGGGAATLCNSTPITNSTNFIDKNVDFSKDNVYTVKTVNNGVEEEKGESYTITAETPNRAFIPITLKNYNDNVTYDIVHVYVGDIDGDGDFDYIVKRVPQDAKYNSVKLDCYLNTGEFVWTVDLGINQETYINTMTAPVLVADFNADGKAEIISRTYEGTKFGDGFTIGDTNGDGKTDYNSHAGSGSAANVMAGPEFISLIDGATGKELDRNNFISRDLYTQDKNGWGDNYGARVNFIMSSVGSFDGTKPGAIFSRGEGSCMVIEAWDVVNNKLHKLWNWSSKGKSFAVGGWTDFHQIQCIDVNGDGKDETSWGCCMMNPDGTVRYTTKYCHGDRLIITDINPNRPGLEAFIVQQKNPQLIGSALYDAATGNTIKDWYLSSLADVGRGDVADIDPTSPGMEMYDSSLDNIHAADGGEVSVRNGLFPAISVWWDGDLLREKFSGANSTLTNPILTKWIYQTQKEDRLWSMYNDWGNYSVIAPYSGRAAMIADVFGDWREEIFLETSDHTTLRIYTSQVETDHRIYTLMQNHCYRNNATTKGYLCSKYTDYYIGEGMQTPPVPNILEVRTEPIIKSVDLTATAGESSITLSWKYQNFANSGVIVQVMKNNNPDISTRGRLAYAPVDALTFEDTDVVPGQTYYYWLKVTVGGEELGTEMVSATIKSKPATLAKCGEGNISQKVEQKAPIVEFCYTWENANTVVVDGLPNGVNAEIDETAHKVTISGTADDTVGVYSYTISTAGGSPDSLITGEFTIEHVATSLSIVSADNNLNLEAYPIPVKNDLHLVFTSDPEENYNLTISNMYGVVVCNKEIDVLKGNKEYELDCSNLSAGVYYLILKGENSLVQKRILVE
ncbi:MAG: T9SS type A sorting domain-containing protein [Paludibacteraceae bacterium]|nr:T9SS type A sorting domain-containing protein [Paludibacteraceae bacterium]